MLYRSLCSPVYVNIISFFKFSRLCERFGILLACGFHLHDRIVINTVIVTAGTFERNESGRFGTLKSDSIHHFFRNACTKSGSLRFHSFPVVD